MHERTLCVCGGGVWVWVWVWVCVWVCVCGCVCADECTNKSKVWKVRLQKLNMHSVALMITWSVQLLNGPIFLKTCTEVRVVPSLMFSSLWPTYMLMSSGPFTLHGGNNTHNELGTSSPVHITWQ